MLYEQQDALNTTYQSQGLDGVLDSFKTFAEDLGLDTSEFGDCLDSGKYTSEVQSDLQDGIAAGVGGTPAFFVNGVSISGAQPFSVFQQLIDAALASAGEAEQTATPEAEAGPPPVQGESTTTSSGLQYIDIEVGSGESPETGDTVVVHYTGWLTDGTKFDSSVDRGEPFSFTIGTGQVIPGWDEGVATMKVGGTRRLIVPPDLGYGESGYPPVIPANAELTFDVELLQIQ